MQKITKRCNSNEKNLYFDVESFGLCNQLFSLACGVADAIVARKNAVFRGFYPDMVCSNCVSLDVLLNLDETNRNLAVFETKILKANKHVRFRIPNMFATSDVQQKLQEDCLKSLCFCDEIQKSAREIAPKTKFYCVHFRLDVDAVLFYCAGFEIYKKWISLTNNKREQEARELVSSQIKIHKNWIQDKIQQYVDAIEKKCLQVDIALFFLTAIGKKNIHLGQNDLIEWAFLELESKLTHRTILRNKTNSTDQRELAAAVELCVACLPDCIGFIASSGSTFSKTIQLRIAEEKLLCIV